MEAVIIIQLYRDFWKHMSFYLQKACVFNLLNMLMLRCNVLGKGEIDGGVCVFTSCFKSILAASILVMLIVSIQKKELINEFSLWFISILCVGVSAITLFMSGFIVDEYNLGGDSVSFDMFIGIVCISGLNFIIYYRRK